MTLRETVSKIRGYEVGETYARMFASEQYGVLASFIRGQLIENLAKERPRTVKPTAGKPIKTKHYSI